MAVGRRGLLLAAACCAARPATAEARRIAVIDWGLTQTLLSLGITPVATAEIPRYMHWVREPPIPPGVVDLGLRSEPNLELLHRTSPDLILSTPQFAPFLPSLESVAPVTSFATYVSGGDPLERSRSIAGEIGRLVGREAAAQLLLDRADMVFEAEARRLSLTAGRPLLVASFVDARHLRVYGRNSLFGATLARLGLANAWPEGTNFWGFATIPLERLAVAPEARLLIVGPLPPAVPASFASNPLWQALPAVRAGRATMLPPCWAFGALPSAMRFASMLPHG